MRFLATWFTMLAVSIANGAVRDFTYGRRMDELAAHQLSTAFGAVLLGVVVAVHVRGHPPSSSRAALALGLAWTALTIAFEFLFFHFVGGHPWSRLLANYDLAAGRVWVLLLGWIAVAPWLFRVLHDRRMASDRGGRPNGTARHRPAASDGA